MSKELFHFELSELCDFLMNVCTDEQFQDKADIDMYVQGVKILAENADSGKAVGIASLGSKIDTLEQRIKFRHDFTLRLLAALNDQARELQQRCREQRAAEAANDCGRSQTITAAEMSNIMRGQFEEAERVSKGVDDD